MSERLKMAAAVNCIADRLHIQNFRIAEGHRNTEPFKQDLLQNLQLDLSHDMNMQLLQRFIPADIQ
ncbi:hypothetical protein D3C86_2177600 [compost metagenome]